MEAYKQLAEALGETLEAICNMREEERAQLMNVCNIRQAETVQVDEYDIDQEFAGESSRKTPPKRKRGRDYFNDDDDDDFVKTSSPKAFKFKFTPDKDLLRVYDQSSGSGSQGRVTRRAANRANLNNREIAKSLDDVDNDQDFNVNEVEVQELPQLVPQRTRKETEEVILDQPELESEPAPNSVEADENENIAEMFEKVNKMCKQKVMLNHIRDPQALFNSCDELPSMDVHKLTSILDKSHSKSPSKRFTLRNHLKTLKKISKNALAHGSLSTLSWQRLCNSRSRLINVNIDDKEAEEANIAPVFDLEDIHIEEEPTKSKSGSPELQKQDDEDFKASKPRQRRSISLVRMSGESSQPKPGPSSAQQKVVIKPAKYRIPKLKSKEKQQGSQELKINHFYDKIEDGKDGAKAEEPPVVHLEDEESGPQSPVYNSSPRKRLAKKIRASLNSLKHCARCQYCDQEIFVDYFETHVEGCKKRASDNS